MLELLYRYIARSLFRDRRSDGSKTASPVGPENRTRDDRRRLWRASPLRRTEVRARRTNSHGLAPQDRQFPRSKIEKSARPARAHIRIRQTPHPTRSAPQTAHAPPAAAIPCRAHSRIRQIRHVAPPCGSKFRSPAARARRTCVGAHYGASQPLGGP